MSPATKGSSKFSTRTDGVIVPPRSKQNIAANAQVVRQFLQLENYAYFPVVDVYERLDLMFEGARFEVLEEAEMGDEHGRTYPDRGLIQIRNDVYERAADGEPRDRFTLCHELGHLMMHRGIALSRIDPTSPPKIYCNSEWQADIFASYLLIPPDLLESCASIPRVMAEFGVSFEAARARKNELQ